MEHRKHLVMMNVEADVTIGAYLKREAARLGVVYTLGAGDEPSSCMELVNFVTGMGYPIVAAGLVPDKAGMHGPSCSITELEHVLCPIADGGILSRKGVAPGVFVIAEMSHPRVRERLHDLKLGAGPYYRFFRPYHLTSLEVPLSCARAVLYGIPDMQPRDVPTSEVCAVAKKDLKVGERLDATGEYTYRAWIMSVAVAVAAKGVPCGLIENGKVTKPIKMGELLTTENITIDTSAKIVTLRKRQDDMLKAS